MKEDKVKDSETSQPQEKKRMGKIQINNNAKSDFDSQKKKKEKKKENSNKKGNHKNNKENPVQARDSRMDQKSGPRNFEGNKTIDKNSN